MAIAGASYKAEYLGGHSLFPKKMKCTLVVAPNGLSIPEMGLMIPYERVNKVQVITEKEISALRYAFLGVIGLLWKKKKKMLLVSYTDETGITHDMVFDVKKKKVDEAAMVIYQQVAAAKRAAGVQQPMGPGPGAPGAPGPGFGQPPGPTTPQM